MSIRISIKLFHEQVELNDPLHHKAKTKVSSHTKPLPSSALTSTFRSDHVTLAARLSLNAISIYLISITTPLMNLTLCPALSESVILDLSFIYLASFFKMF